MRLWALMGFTHTHKVSLLEEEICARTTLVISSMRPRIPLKFNRTVGVDARNETSKFWVCLIQESLRFIAIHLILTLTCSPTSFGDSNSKWMENAVRKSHRPRVCDIVERGQKRQAGLHNCKFQRGVPSKTSTKVKVSSKTNWILILPPKSTAPLVLVV